MLTTLSEGRCGATSTRTPTSTGIRRSSLSPQRPRWILPATTRWVATRGTRHSREERQIEIGMWRQANVAKVGLHFESILIRGLMDYAFWVPNGSPEYRYCLHEAVEECNHTMMFQEMVNRVGADVPGMPRLLRVAFAVDPVGGRAAADRSASACSPAKSPSTTRRKTCCARASRCTRSWSG